jgi:hypothetical protein
MADENTTTPSLGNEAPARLETGELKDQGGSLAAVESSPTPTPPEGSESSLASEAKPTEPTKDSKPEALAVPEKYEFKAPEGYEYNAEALAPVEAKFKELGLTQDQASAVMDLYAAETARIENEPFQAYNDMQNGWKQEVFKDPALGTGTAIRPEVAAELGRIKSALPADLRDSFNEAMDLTGAGNHPAFIRSLLALGKFVTEGRPVTGSGPAAQPGAKPSAAQAIYAHLPSAAR